MATFDGLQFKSHPNIPGGVQAIVDFENGYSASVVKNAYSYGGPDGLFELAVFDGNGLTYETPITNDVEGWLSESRVTALLGQIEALPAAPTKTESQANA